MHSFNDTVTMQDTSTQAMTEVALGLSMAFFALLIIALMSVALLDKPVLEDITPQNIIDQKGFTVDLANVVELSLAQNSKSDMQNSINSPSDLPINKNAAQDQTIILYWSGQLYNTQQQIITNNEALLGNNIILAVSPQIPFDELIIVQSQFNDKKIRLTTLTEPWQIALQGVKATIN